MKKIFLFIIAFIATSSSFAQESRDSLYSNQPLWIEMMNSPAVNYYEAIKAFDLYWLNKTKPVQENEIFDAKENNERLGEFKSERKIPQSNDTQKYAVEYKKFKHWQKTMLPYVKQDGSIMTKEERLSMWKQQREGRK